VLCFPPSIFQKTINVLSSLFRTCPPSSVAWRIVNQNGQTYFEAESRKKFTPRYGFLLTRLRGNPVDVDGLRHGTTPCSSRLIILSVTIA
jgi:hypothetical protein